MQKRGKHGYYEHGEGHHWHGEERPWWGPECGYGMEPGPWWHGWRNWYRSMPMPPWMRFGGVPCCPGPCYPGREPSREQELHALKERAEWMKEHLDAINARIAELEKGGESETDEPPE
jgi:hypothetical protein